MTERTLKVLDLFAGAGGLSLGFEAAGTEAVGFVERNQAAAATLERMFVHENATVLGGPSRGDVRNLTPKTLLSLLPAAPDIVIGGPPCQGFSRIGRAKQRSLLDERERVRHGGLTKPDRNSLYRVFFDIVDHCRPVAFVMENVPGMLCMLGVDMARRISREAASLGYNVRYFLLNAAWYGVPQNRWRLFFVGLRSDLGMMAIPRPPLRTHHSDQPLADEYRCLEDPWVLSVDQIPGASSLKDAITVREAIGDLPRLTAHLRGGPTPDDSERLPLRRRPSEWAAALRRWPLRDAPGTVSGHWYRSTPRDYRIFRDMGHGDRYPEALVIARQLFREHLDDLRRDGSAPSPGTPAYEALRSSFVPPYRNDAFDDKWRKLIPNRPSWTVTAHLSRDAYSHIHYHSAQARTITIREAARLQSFPDAFEFSGNRGDQFSQIGNAVPPLLARAIATELLDQLAELGVGTGAHPRGRWMTPSSDTADCDPEYVRVSA